MLEAGTRPETRGLICSDGDEDKIWGFLLLAPLLDAGADAGWIWGAEDGNRWRRSSRTAAVTWLDPELHRATMDGTCEAPWLQGEEEERGHQW